MNEYSFIKSKRRFVISTKAKTGEKYHRILEAAVSVFAKQGFYQTTISQIAREAGVADGTIYLYFKNKDDILVQFFTYKAKQVFAGFRKEVDKAGNAIDKLRNLVHRHLEEFQKDRNMAVVYQSLTHQHLDIVEDNIREMSKMYLDIVADIVERGQEEGAMRRDLYLGLVKRFILGSVESAINTWLYSKRKYDLVSMTDPLIDLFVRGIGNYEQQ
ncbi:Transcriptional regulator, TetR family [Desulfonema limicola]|uniref:Transcriptional regulator, TetR family n=1 Tax=Desulfonema limicola TaxID=45656 RepID=A0A975B9V9_9BACT|nr:TetR/AcrR family transcriptional regulator [Desulfonema limicola]QTA81381.1 Transcriptional regulator, TetR family [Desulfonema limicola]